MSERPRRRAPPMRVPEKVVFSDRQEPIAAAPAEEDDRSNLMSAEVVEAQRRGIRRAAQRSSGDAAGAAQPRRPAPFLPDAPRTWEELEMDPQFAVGLVLRYMLEATAVPSKRIAWDLCVAHPIVRYVMEHLKNEGLVSHRSATALGDFVSELTEAGYQRAVASRSETTYVGPIPVSWKQYLASVKAQTLRAWSPGRPELDRAFHDLTLSDELLDQLGPAVTSCQPMFLFGDPGNGKTSLAERMTACFGETIWIPKALLIGNNLIKLYDPSVHVAVDNDRQVLAQSRVDQRWIRIKRPTVMAGGELTLEQLEVKVDTKGHVHEAPLQLKANCGTMVIDDFGRGKTDAKELLNRWIFPLERGQDFLAMPDGRKISVPFECMLVFSTNLEPKDLADEAFLRRIPYKVHVRDPSAAEFAALTKLLARKLEVELPHGSVEYLIGRHYNEKGRAMRFCHPRDLLLQVAHLCAYQRRPAVAGPREWDRVVANYFGAG